MTGVAKREHPPVVVLDSRYRECQWPGCMHPSVWTFEHHCGAETFECEQHRREHDRMLALGRSQTCRTCGTPGPNPIPWVLR